ncbi:MAG: branched-chain amino acid ABC transporter permease [Nakamurella sp.]
MSYFLVIATTVVIYAVLSVGLNIAVGYAGQPHLAQGAFLGIGAYMVAVFSTRYGLSFWLCVLIAIVVTALSGFVLGVISLRLRDDFLAIVTIGLNFVVVAIFQYVPWFGGATGVYAIPLPSIGGHEFGNPEFLLLGLVMLAISVAVSGYISRTWLGLGLASIRDDELASASSGTPVASFKIAAFVVASAIAGMAGALYAPFLSAVTPTSFGFTESIVMLAMVMFGGVGTIRGAILGAIVLGALPEAFRFVSDYRLLIFGAILVLVLRFQPHGIIGTDSAAANAWKRLFSRPPKTEYDASCNDAASAMSVAVHGEPEQPGDGKD